MHDAKATQVVPGDALAATVVGRNLAAHFLGHGDGLGHGVVAEEENPVRFAVRPRGLRHAVGAGALGNVGLLDVADVLVAANFAVHNQLEASVRVLVDGFKVVFERAQGGWPCERVVVVAQVGRNVSFLHLVDDGLGVAVVKGHAVSAGDGAVGVQRNSSSVSATGRNSTQQRLVKLVPRKTVKGFDGIVF